MKTREDKSPRINFDCVISAALDFISLFKAESGFTPHRYILRLRMQKARRLLITGRRVSEVALEVGYQDAASFTRAFKAVNGVTPQQYALGDAVILR